MHCTTQLALRLCLALSPVFLLAGCGVTGSDSAFPMTGAALQGRVFGGQQPVSGAQIYLLAASTAGYGQASTSLLNTTLLPSDSLGAYVTSDTNGNFSITGDYLCTPNTQVYLYAKGGNPGAGVNANIGLLAVLGSCPATRTFATSVPFLIVNEVTTVAAAYALAGFATDPAHVAASSTALAETGLANAFLNASNLASISSGAALLTTPAGNGTAPQARVNTLANVLAACINSNPGTSTNCGTLLTNAQAAGAAPTDTAAAMINIAHNPGASVTTLYSLTSSTAPFGPALTVQPADFTLPITYTGARLSNFAGNFPYGETTSVAVDAAGNVFTTDPTLGAMGIDKFSSTGADLSSSSAFIGNSTDAPSLVRLGPSNNVWVANTGQNHANLAQFTNGGALLSGVSGYNGGAFTSTSGGGDFAFDPSGNVVVTAGSTFVRFNSAGQLAPPATAYPSPGSIEYMAFDSPGDLWFTNGSGLNKVLPTGALASGSPFTGGGLSPYGFGSGLALDAGNNVWVAGYNANGGGPATNVIGVFNNAGQPLFPSGITDPGSNQPTDLELDGAGTAFLSDSNSTGNGSQLVRVVTAGATLTSTAVYGTGFLNTVYTNLALDCSGNAWVVDFLESSPTFSNARLVQFVGLAAPVVTPMSAGVANATLATRP